MRGPIHRLMRITGRRASEIREVSREILARIYNIYP